MRRDINIYRIAEEAGVSVSTVSRVMTHSARVSENKKKRVQEIIAKYDYRPNVLAQGLSLTSTRTIGILSADLENPFYTRILTECAKEIDRRGYSPICFGTLSNYELEVKYLQKAYDMRVDALILIGGKSDELITDADFSDLINRISDAIPVVTSGKVDGTRCRQVCIDEIDSVDMAMNHLFSLGHRDIALVGGRSDVRSTYEKRARYRNLLRSRGIPFREEYVVDSAYNADGGYRGMNRILDSQRSGMGPTAVMAINDFSAIGVLHSLEEHRLSVPEDMAVVSFDNTFIADSMIPKLTSVGYDYAVFGRMLVDAAIDAAERREVPAFQKVPSELYIRASSQAQRRQNA